MTVVSPDHDPAAGVAAGEGDAVDAGVDDGVFRAAFAASPGNAAVLDGDGVILAVNEGWRRFAGDNELADADALVGADYVAACRRDGDETGRRAAEGVAALLAGERERFGLEYPCHSPAEKRWFLMRAVAFDHGPDRYALVTHLDITGRREAELEVRRRRNELEDVVSLLAHDVRNPLGVAAGWLETVAPADDREADALDRVAASLDRIEATVEDALSFMAADVTSTDRRVVDAGGRARSLWADLGGDPDRLVVAEPVEVDCHPDLFSHLLENLLANARQHGGDSVIVTVGPTEDGFFVADDGPGIDPDRREAVFETGETSAAAGTGFGLAIVETVAERHGWSVSVGESDQGGARFEVRTRPAIVSSDGGVPDAEAGDD